MRDETDDGASFRAESDGSLRSEAAFSETMTGIDNATGWIPRVDVLQVEVSAIGIETAVGVIRDWVESGAREYVCVRDVHGVVASQHNPELIEIHRRAGLVTPDGMPLVWCSRLAGASWVQRVRGADLMLAVCRETQEDGLRHFFYGAEVGVAVELAANLQEWFPGIEVVGTHSPPYRELTDEEVEKTIALINAAGPQIVWVGLSTPKQEVWMSKFREYLDAPVLIGVGAAFDMHAGRVPQAPVWMRRSGFEWLFRLLAEPKRLWRRYFRTIPWFIFNIARRPPRLIRDPSTTS